MIPGNTKISKGMGEGLGVAGCELRATIEFLDC